MLNLNKILTYVSSTFLFVILATGCSFAQRCSTEHIHSSHAKNTISHRSSFVKIEAYIFLLNAGPTVIGSGSGSIIHHGENKTIILTADHICKKNKVKIMDGISFPVLLKAIDINGKEYELSRGASSNTSDLCLTETKEKVNFPALKLAERATNIGEASYNLAAPNGVFGAGMVLMLHGHYAGNMLIPTLNKKKLKVSVYSIPARGGSSGSPILNEAGDLVGVIFAGDRKFENLSLSVTFSQLDAFLRVKLPEKFK